MSDINDLIERAQRMINHNSWSVERDALEEAIEAITSRDELITALHEEVEERCQRIAGLKEDLANSYANGQALALHGDSLRAENERLKAALAELHRVP